MTLEQLITTSQHLEYRLGSELLLAESTYPLEIATLQFLFKTVNTPKFSAH
jgi:hypothetical protein